LLLDEAACALSDDELLDGVVALAGGVLCADWSLVIAPDVELVALLDGAVWLDADWSEDEVMAPDVPPIAPAPWLAEAEPEEQVSETLLTLETVITFPELEPAVVPLLLVWALAEEALPANEPLICTCWPMWLCSWLFSPCSW
jgi:hypothetical protein